VTSRVFGIAQAILYALFSLVLWLDPAPRTIGGDPFLVLVGDLLCLLGVGLLFVALRTIGPALRFEPAPRPGAPLVTRGVYGRLRHPMDTAIVLVVFGLTLRGVTPWGAALAGAIVVFVLVRARYEETLLLARYPEYAEHRARTRGVFVFF
jgi:protein-S-isoprenylcysteine O-methyltransferase Ste14